MSEEVSVQDGLTRPKFEPDYEVWPGKTLRETLETHGMSQAEFARRADLSTKHVNQIIQGEAPITLDTAFALELVTDVPADVWTGLETTYQAHRRRRTVAEVMTEEDRAWVHAMPVTALIKRRIIPDTQDIGLRFKALLRFFGVANRRAWEGLWETTEASFHKSAAFEQKPYPTAVWLRFAELRAAGKQAEPFDRAKFKDAAREIRDWVPEPITPALIARMKDLLASTGVVLVIVREFEGSRASGATKWLSGDKVLIALSLRYKRDDHFWFTFFHEVAHVLLHRKRETFIDVDRGEEAETKPGQEAEADQFAANVLIPREFVSRLRALCTADEVGALAAELNLPPGVVVGRMQRLKVVDWNTPLNRLRGKFDAEALESAVEEAITVP